MRLVLCVLLCVIASFACGTKTGLRQPHVDASLDPHDAGDVPTQDRAPVEFDVVDPCTLARLGIVDIGCPFPDGRRIPFGQSVTTGCVTCQCEESGRLFCTDACPHPEDDGGANIHLVCVLPDGRRVANAAWYQVASTWCYCDSGGGSQCRLIACADVQPGAVSPPPVRGLGGASCNSVGIDLSNTPTVAFVPGSRPSIRYGPIADGTYVLRTISRYAGSTVPAQTASTLVVSGATWQVVRLSATGAAVARATFEARRNFEGIELWETCPEDIRGIVTLPDGGTIVVRPGQPYNLLYSARGAILDIFGSDSPIVFSYERQ